MLCDYCFASRFLETLILIILMVILQTGNCHIQHICSPYYAIVSLYLTKYVRVHLISYTDVAPTILI